MPLTQVSGLARQAGASLVVLSSATAASAALAAEAVRGLARPGLRVLAGQPGDPLSRLRQKARSTQP